MDGHRNTNKPSALENALLRRFGKKTCKVGSLEVLSNIQTTPPLIPHAPSSTTISNITAAQWLHSLEQKEEDELREERTAIDQLVEASELNAVLTGRASEDAVLTGTRPSSSFTMTAHPSSGSSTPLAATENVTVDT